MERCAFTFLTDLTKIEMSYYSCYRCKQPSTAAGCGCRDGVSLIHGNSRDVLPSLEPGSVSAVVTDPPYGTNFLGESWDASIPAIWEPLLTACRPGAHLLAFGSPRTYHRLACAIEDAGWIIRDCIMWVHAMGMPKSFDVSKSIDKAAGATREVIGKTAHPDGRPRNQIHRDRGCHGGGQRYNGVGLDVTAPATDAAKLWAGYGSSLKPSHEPILLCRKPLDGTLASNCLQHGCGALNIEACKIPLDPAAQAMVGKAKQRTSKPSGHIPHDPFNKVARQPLQEPIDTFKASGRWPGNFVHDGSPEVVERFPNTVSGTPAGTRKAEWFNGATERGTQLTDFGDSGSAARFFFCAKASAKERGLGNDHATVKPLSLMDWLCKLVSPPEHKGILLDPFAGSCTTLLAGTRWFNRVIGIELYERHCKIAVTRLSERGLFT